MKTITKITYPGFALLALACFALSPTAQAGRPHPSPTPSPTPTPPPAATGFPKGIKAAPAPEPMVLLLLLTLIGLVNHQPSLGVTLIPVIMAFLHRPFSGSEILIYHL